MKTVEQKIAEGMAAFVFVATILYFGGHVLAAWLHGAFSAVIR